MLTTVRENTRGGSVQVWMQMSGANKLKEPGVYESYLNDHANKFSLATQQIELVRCIPAYTRRIC